MAKPFFPTARLDNLVIQELGSETLIYNTVTNQAHCLNETAAFVWTSCDGDTSIDAIARSFESRFGQPVDADVVKLAVSQLSSKDLLLAGSVNVALIPSRRDVVKKIGLATAIAIPVVASLVAPRTAFAALSCRCVSAGDCLVQTTCPSTVNCNNAGLCAS